VPDERFEWLCELYKPSSRVPAFLTCIDIAGLTAVCLGFLLLGLVLTSRCQGASTGAGLGNAFLSHVRAVDGIFQVVRAFDDAEVIHVEGDVNPLRDMEIIQTELRLKDIEWVQKRVDDMKKTTRSLGTNSLADKAKKEELVCLDALLFCQSSLTTFFSQATTEKILKVLSEDGKDVRKADWNNKEVSSRTSSLPFLFMFVSCDEKERIARYNPAR
jgi:obg-like ATPase 1